jgi:hypothetical protein
MAVANKFPINLHAKFQALVNAITALLPNTVPSPSGSGVQTFSGFDFSFGSAAGQSQAAISNGFRIVLEVDPTGQNLTIRSIQSDEGQNNAYGLPDGGPAGHYLRVPAIVIPATSMP